MATFTDVSEQFVALLVLGANGAIAVVHVHVFGVPWLASAASVVTSRSLVSGARSASAASAPLSLAATFVSPPASSVGSLFNEGSDPTHATIEPTTRKAT